MENPNPYQPTFDHDKLCFAFGGESPLVFVFLKLRIFPQPKYDFSVISKLRKVET